MASLALCLEVKYDMRQGVGIDSRVDSFSRSNVNNAFRFSSLVVQYLVELIVRESLPTSLLPFVVRKIRRYFGVTRVHPSLVSLENH